MAGGPGAAAAIRLPMTAGADVDGARRAPTMAALDAAAAIRLPTMAAAGADAADGAPMMAAPDAAKAMRVSTAVTGEAPAVRARVKEPEGAAAAPINAPSSGDYFGTSSKYLLFSHTQSRSSVSGISSHPNDTVHGLAYAFGSSIVICTSMWPKSVRRNRSMMCSASL